MNARRITRSQYVQLVGLLELAARHNAALKEILAAALKLTADQELGLTDDAVYSAGSYNAHTADSLLERLGIAIVDESEAVSDTAVIDFLERLLDEFGCVTLYRAGSYNELASPEFEIPPHGRLRTKLDEDLRKTILEERAER